MQRILMIAGISFVLACAGCGEPDKNALTNQVNEATDKARNVENMLDEAASQQRRQIDEMTE